MRRHAVAVLLLLAPFAEARSQEVVGPNGRPAHVVTCSESEAGSDECFRRAMALCPNGFTILSGESAAKVIAAIGGTAAPSESIVAIECK